MIVLFTSDTADSAMIHIPEETEWRIEVNVDPLTFDFIYDGRRFCIASEQDFTQSRMSLPQEEIKNLFNDALDKTFSTLSSVPIANAVINLNEIMSELVDERFEYWISKFYIKC